MGKKIKKLKVKRVRHEVMGLAGLTVVLLALLFFLFFWRNAIIQIAVQKGVEKVTGLKVEMGTFNLGLYKSVVKATDLKIYNPEGFPDEVMVDIPEVFVNYDLKGIMKKDFHFYEMKLILREFTVIRNEKRELNLHSLKSIRRTPQKPASAKPRGLAALRIDDLDLQIGRVVYKDLAARWGPTEKEYKVNIHERYKNISNTRSLISLIVFKALAKTTITRLTNFDLASVKSAASDILNTAVNLPFTGFVEETIQAIKGTAQAVSDTLKSPLPGR